MSAIIVNNLRCLQADSAFTEPLEFEVEFECVQALEEAFEWRVTYISNPADSQQDQVLDSFEMNAP